MPTLPHAGFFDRIEPLNPNQDNGLDWSESPFANTTSLSGSLPSFLIWQDEFAYAWAVKKNIHFILAHYNKYVYMPVPPQPVTEESLAWAFGYMASVNGPGPGISRIEGVTHLGLKKPPVGPYQPRPILTEYIYDRSHVASLQGNDFRSQRALLNHLLREEKVLFRPYRSSDLKACCELFELWKGQRLPALQGQMGEKMILSAQKAHLRALLQGERVGMSSWVVFVGERLAAYTSGAPLNPETYGIFLEVADLSVKGLSAYVFTTLCRQLEGYRTVNTGDAEGLPHLAESKEHWHPIKKLALYALDPL